MRRFIPRTTDLATLPNRRFRSLIAACNNTPRKCLDFSTPAETFAQVLHFVSVALRKCCTSQVLHFECEPPPRPSPGRLVEGCCPRLIQPLRLRHFLRRLDL